MDHNNDNKDYNNDYNRKFDLKKNMSQLIIKYNIPFRFIDDLLNILKESSFNDLPLSTRTLLKMNTVKNIIKSGVEYAYLDLKYIK